MTAAPARIGLASGSAAKTGDIVISIDAMGGDRGVADVLKGMGKSLKKNPRLRYILHGDAGVLEPAIHAGSRLAERTEVRHAPGVVAMDEKPSRALRNAQGTSMWSALEAVKSGESPVVISCGNTGALMALADARAAQGAGRRSAGDRRALAVAEPDRLQRAARRRGRYPRRRRRPRQVRGDGRVLCPQRARPEAAARRAAQRRHRGAQGPHRAARGGRARRRDRSRQRFRVHRLCRGRGHAVRPRRRHRHRRLHRQRGAEDRRGHGADDPGPAARGLRLHAAVADRRPLRAHLAQAAAEAHRPAPGQRRGLPRPQRDGHQVARLGRRHRRLGGDQARLHPRRPRLHRAAGRPRGAGAGRARRGRGFPT